MGWEAQVLQATTAILFVRGQALKSALHSKSVTAIERRAPEPMARAVKGKDEAAKSAEIASSVAQAAASKAGGEKKAGSWAFLIFCTVGIYACYLYYGILMERLAHECYCPHSSSTTCCVDAAGAKTPTWRYNYVSLVLQVRHAPPPLHFCNTFPHCITVTLSPTALL